MKLLWAPWWPLLVVAMILFQHSPNELNCNDQYSLHNHQHKCNYQSQHHKIQCWNNLSSMLKCFDQLHWRNQLEYSYFHMFCKHNLSYEGINGPKPFEAQNLGPEQGQKNWKSRTNSNLVVRGFLVPSMILSQIQFKFNFSLN